MKVIDLINKMANNEALPKGICFDEDIYELNPEWNNYINEEDGGCTFLGAVDSFFNMGEKLNEEIEIIEENQNINIQSIEELGCSRSYWGTDNVIENRKKIDEIIQAIKQLDRQINNN